MPAGEETQERDIIIELFLHTTIKINTHPKQLHLKTQLKLR